MRRICARCKRDLGSSPGDERVSHGLCAVCAEVDWVKFADGHELVALAPGRDDDSTHECRRCGGLVEIEPDGTVGYPLAGPCSGRLGVYHYRVARTRPADRSLDDDHLGF